MSAPPEPREDHETSSLGDAPMRAAIVSVFVCGLCFAVVGAALFGARTGLGVLIGGALAGANLLVFARVGQAFIARQGNTAPWGLVAVLKLLLLFGGVWILLKSDLVSGLALAAGYAALPFGVAFASLFGPKPSGDDHPPTQSSRRGADVIKPPRAGKGHPDSEP